MAAKDLATGGLLSGPRTTMRRRTRPFPSHANTLPEEKEEASRRLFRGIARAQEAAEQAAVAVARDQVDVADEGPG